MNFLKALGRFWTISLYVGLILVWTFPLFVNYNMDINNYPKTVSKNVDTRFDYMEDLLEPLGFAVAMTALIPITDVLIVIEDYRLVTNSIKPSEYN
jgi:hypothetical protein